MSFAGTAATSLAGPVIVPGWGAPVFRDEFDGNAVNEGVWQVANWPSNNNNELQYYHPNQALVSDGVLKLRADRDPNWSFGREYNSGLLRSWQEWSYGRVEVRAKLPNGQGFWPAIWMLPRTVDWPVGGEIDIMEARGDRPYGMSAAIHWGWDAANRQYASQWYESGANFQAGFHTYAVEWDVGTVGFFVDGVEHYRLYEPAVGIPGTAKSIVLNLAVGGDYSGFPDWTTPFPSQFEIDYVRVWQRSEPIAPPTSLVVDPGFEDADGGLADWPRFGNAIDNVTSDWGTPLDGQRSLKLYGQFDGQENYSGVLQNVAVNGGETFLAGAHALTRSEDSIVGTGNTAFLKVEFYSEAGAEYGSASFLGEVSEVIADGNMAEDSWVPSELTATAPTDAVEARLSIVFLQPSSNPGGAVFVDSVTLTNAACLISDVTTSNTNPRDPGYGEADGTVDGADLSFFVEWWLRGSPTIADLTTTNTNPGDSGYAEGDGVVDGADLSFYVENWLTGCL